MHPGGQMWLQTPPSGEAFPRCDMAFLPVLKDVCLAQKNKEHKIRYFYVSWIFSFTCQRREYYKISQASLTAYRLSRDGCHRRHLPGLEQSPEDGIPALHELGVRPFPLGFSISVLDLLCQNVSIQKYFCIFQPMTILTSVQFVFNQRPFLWKAQ